LNVMSTCFLKIRTLLLSVAVFCVSPLCEPANIPSSNDASASAGGGGVPLSDPEPENTLFVMVVRRRDELRAVKFAS